MTDTNSVETPAVELSPTEVVLPETKSTAELIPDSVSQEIKAVITDDAKKSPDDVNYRKGEPDRHCSVCMHFKGDKATCAMVNAPVKGTMLCDEFKPIEAMKSLSLYVTKAVIHNGTMRWAATGSDTDPDSHDEACSIKLFKSFIEVVEKANLIPYLSIAHYPRLEGKGIAGEADSIYIDGKQLKAKGFIADTPAGRALFKSLSDDRKSSRLDKIRISLAWYDLEHEHTDGSIFTRKSLAQECPTCKSGVKIKTYLRGVLDHLAATRVPVNKRTSLDLEMKSMAITRQSDAASIVGDEIAEELELAAKGKATQKSLVVRSDAGLPAAAYAIVGDASVPETWKIQLWENETLKVTPKQLSEAVKELDALPVEERQPVALAIKSAYRQLGVKSHTWPESIRPALPPVPDTWESFATSIVALAQDQDTAGYVPNFVKSFKSKVFDTQLSDLEEQLLEITQKGDLMDDLQLNPSDPFESVLIKFQTALDGIHKSEASIEEKNQAVKDSFSQVADAYIQMCMPEAETPAISKSEIANIVDQQVTKAMTPLLEKLNALLEKQATPAQAAPAPITEPEPKRKSQATAVAPVVQKSEGPLSVSDIVKRQMQQYA